SAMSSLLLEWGLRSRPSEPESSPGPSLDTPRRSRLVSSTRRGVTKSLRRAARRTVGMVGAALAPAVVVLASVAGLPPPLAPDEQNFDLIEAKPGPKALFGTDRFGRDVLSRVIYGARVSLYVAVTSIGLAMLVGGALGLTAGYVGGVWDNAINRVMDVFFSIPGLLLAVRVAAVRRAGVDNAGVAITIVYTPLLRRV